MNLEGNCKFPTNTADAHWRNATDSYSIRYTCESWHLKCVGNIDLLFRVGRYREGGQEVYECISINYNELEVTES